MILPIVFLMKSWWNSLSKSEKSMYGGITLILLLSLIALFSDDLFSSLRKRSGEPVGVVTLTQRDVRFKAPDQIGWQPTQMTQDAYLGETYFTGNDSTTKIKLKDGTEIVLEPNSMITLTKLDDQVNLNLEFGRVKALGSEQSKVKIQGRNIAGNFEVQKRELKKVKSNINWITPPPNQIFHFQNNKFVGLKWTKIPEAQSYVVETSIDPKFEVNVNRKLTRSTEISMNSYPGAGLFFTRVIALGPKNEELSLSSSQKSESVSMLPPQIQSPKNSESVAVKVTFENEPTQSSLIPVQWVVSSPYQPEEFEIEVSSKEKLKSQTTSLKLKAQKLGPESVRVRGLFGSAKTPGPWSEVVPFLIVAGEKQTLAAPSFKKLSIEHDANISPYPQLQWNSIDGIKEYEVQFSSTPQFKKPLTIISQNSQIKLTSQNLGRSFARVRALAGKSKSSWSEKAQINITSSLVRAKPVPPKVVFGKTPEDEAKPEVFDLQWSPNPGVKKYKVEISNSAQFTKKQVIIAQGNKTTVTVKKPGELFWRIKPLDNQKRSIASFNEPLPIIYQFKVPLSTPILTSKSQRLTVVVQNKSSPFPIELSWKEVRQAEKYELQISQDKDFNQIYYQTVTPQLYWKISQNLPGGLVYWRVRALGEDSKISNWSNIGAFETRSGRIPSRWANGVPP